jgi:aminoglycoside phosphotransferase (APT) family kinase protein
MDPPDLSPPIPREALDLKALARWMSDHVEGAEDAELTTTLAPGGRSNLTFFMSQGDRQWVLRRPPLGHVLPSAHDMRREYTVLSALQGTDVPVPRVRAYCDDRDVVGAPFYVMDFVAGHVLRDANDTARLEPDQRRQLSATLVDVLARVHGVDWEGVGLHDFGRPSGYLERQITRWSQHWDRSCTRDLPAMAELATYLSAALPPASPPALVHGDFRLDNVMYSLGGPARPLAVLDWEMSTVGDPLADLGLLLVYWPDPSDGFDPPSVAPQIGGQDGFLSRAELVARYAQATGRDLTHLSFYIVFGYFKLAVILEGIHRRHTMGRTLGAGFDHIGDEVPQLVDRAFAVARHGLPGASGDGIGRR